MYIIIFHATIGSPTIRISQLPGSLESVKFKTEIAAMLVFCSLLLVLQQGGMDRALFAAEANREQPFSWQQGPDTAPQFDDPNHPTSFLSLQTTWAGMILLTTAAVLLAAQCPHPISIPSPNRVCISLERMPATPLARLQGRPC